MEQSNDTASFKGKKPQTQTHKPFLFLGFLEGLGFFYHIQNGFVHFPTHFGKQNENWYSKDVVR